MNLTERIYKTCKGVEYPLSVESLTTLVLFNISKQDYFKNNYDNFSLFKSDNEYYISSNFRNEQGGFSNGTSNQYLLDRNYSIYDDKIKNVNEKIENESKDEDEDEDEEDYYDDYYYEENYFKLKENDIFYLEDSIFNDIKLFVEIVKDANNFEGVINSLEKKESIIANFYQYYLKNDNLLESNIKKSIEPIFNIVKNLYSHDIRKDFFRFGNNNISFGGTNARDYFGSYLLESLAKNNNDEWIKKIINGNDFYQNEIELLFKDEKTGSCPKSILSILKNKNIENWDAVILFKSENYQNTLLDLVISNDDRHIKHIKIANLFFNELKEIFLLESDNFFKNIKPNSELDDHSNIVNIITEKVIKHYPSLNNIENKELVFTKYDLISEDKYFSKYDQLKDLENLLKLRIYDTDFSHLVTSGLNYLGHDTFKSIASKDNFNIVLKNDDDLIGFGNFYISESKINVNVINIAQHHRGKGHSKEIYQKLIDYAVENNLMIETTMYSIDGQNSLPKMKKDLISKNPNVLWLDTTYNNNQNFIEKELADWRYNGKILQELNTNYKNFDKSLVRTFYDEEYNKIKDVLNENTGFEKKYELLNNFYNNIISNIEATIDFKNKVHKKIKINKKVL